MRGDFDEDEDPDFEPEWSSYDIDDICADCDRHTSAMDECSVCGAVMCGACYEMGAGVCRGPHR
jgi:hypothetical protein